MPNNEPPSLTDDSRAHARNLIAELYGRLVGISQHLAGANKHDNIQCTDVDKALLALKKAGLEAPPPWHKRPNFHIGLGCTLAGIAPSVAGFAVALVNRADHPVTYAVSVIGVPAFLAGLGVAFAITGWMRTDS
jgi:hypothetical protein